MCKPAILFLSLVATPLSIFAQQSNDFFDNTPSRKLPGTLKIEVAGEVANPGVVELERLPLRSLIVRESRLEKGGAAPSERGETAFVGAYRYEGYSLLDILNDRVVARRHGAGFKPQTDLLVAVENAAGERAVLSWGEIYYPASLHRVIIAAAAAPIVPSETREDWPLPGGVKLVCANDLHSERGILNPTKISVFSAPLEIPDKKGLKPLCAPNFQVHKQGLQEGRVRASLVQEFDPAKVDAAKRTYPSVFYGRGKGYHGFQEFSGILLKDALKAFAAPDAAALRNGYLIAAAADGYRIALSFSELFNRNDQAEFLLIDRGEGADGGRYAIFPAADFFSDRALKAVSAIHFLTY